jgi:hypothetical protein
MDEPTSTVTPTPELESKQKILKDLTKQLLKLINEIWRLKKKLIIISEIVEYNDTSSKSESEDKEESNDYTETSSEHSDQDEDNDENEEGQSNIDDITDIEEEKSSSREHESKIEKQDDEEEHSSNKGENDDESTDANNDQSSEQENETSEDLDKKITKIKKELEQYEEENEALRIKLFRKLHEQKGEVVKNCNHAEYCDCIAFKNLMRIWTLTYQSWTSFIENDFTYYNFSGALNSIPLQLNSKIIKFNIKFTAASHHELTINDFCKIFLTVLECAECIRKMGYEDKYNKPLRKFNQELNYRIDFKPWELPFDIVPHSLLANTIKTKLEAFINFRNKLNTAKNIHEKHTGLFNFYNEIQEESEDDEEQDVHSATYSLDEDEQTSIGESESSSDSEEAQDNRIEENTQYLKLFRAEVESRLSNKHSFFDSARRWIMRDSDVHSIYQLTLKTFNKNIDNCDFYYAGQLLAVLDSANQSLEEELREIQQQNNQTPAINNQTIKFQTPV